ncbi:unnamed protein product [Paramecium primaurelia]|uniref:Uncharacterized protein n=2 Tax=Paramecium TaxID=5884 RepID=A0A8S1UUT4_9CILI|nr:unnamed protein product [Paramecium primaurelia]CAD8167662.1 unnamed protein product [Paramecium pentaurelia]
MNPISQKLIVIKDEENNLESKIQFKIDLYSQSLVAKLGQLQQNDIQTQSKKCFKVCQNTKLEVETCTKNCFNKHNQLLEYHKSSEFMGIFKKSSN